MRALLLLLVCQAACATTTVSGTVFLDRNHDRIRQANEPGVGNVVVTLDRTTSVRTRADGTYDIGSVSADGVVWVRVPDGYRPGSVWARAGDARADLPLVPLTADELAAPLSFVVAADTHTTAVGRPAEGGNWDGGDLDDALAQAVALPTPPRFFTIVGDITQANHDGEFARVDDAIRRQVGSVPWIPVPGNHDWYDGGVTWRQRWGPDNYSFDTGNLHVVIWDTNLAEADQLAFFANDLATVEPTQVVVALGHASPTDAVADQLSALGVDYIFSGHWHANRRVERTGLVEWGTQTLVMGTIDQSPSGYRVVTFLDGVPTVEHRARVTAPHLAISSPHAGSCATATTPLLVSVALDASLPTVRARIDCGDEIELSPAGGDSWSFGAALPALTSGTHTIDVVASSPSGRRITRRLDVAACTPPVVAPVAGDWLQVGGSAQHTGSTPRAIAPPLVQRWAVSIGGNVLLGTPVIKDGTVVIATWDLGSGDRGGLVALDLATGVEKWRAITPYAVRSAPAIGGDTVVAALENGELRGFSLADGTPRWSYDVADGVDSLASSLWAAPAIDGDTVFAAVQGRIAAVALADGTPRWTRELTPEYAWLGSLAAIAVASGSAVANVARNDGMTAWNTTTGDMRWKLKTGNTIAIHSTPVIDGSDLYFINAAGVVTRASLSSAQTRWSKALVEGNEWSYSITAAPALANGRLFVPTQYKDLVALDADTGRELWRRTTQPGPLNFAHYRGGEPGFAASPVVTGDILWVPHPDGTLAALEAASGRELWKTSLGAPLVSAPAPAGDTLVVATFDGVVRAMVPSRDARPGPSTCVDPYALPGIEEPTPEAGGCCESSSSSSLLLALVVAGPLARRRRGRARTSPWR